MPIATASFMSPTDAVETTLDYPRFPSHRLDGMAEFVAQMRDRKAAYILQLDSLQSCPEILAGIHFRGIGGEAFHMGPVRRFINPIPIAHRLDRHRLI
jgi:hypothetical protein